jgi:DNA-binding PadR family transcriptional regulator
MNDTRERPAEAGADERRRRHRHDGPHRSHAAWLMAADDIGESGETSRAGRGPRRGRGRGSAAGPGGPGGHGFGHGGFGPGGRRGGGRRGGRGGRGDVRAAVLLLLAEGPMHGYQLIQQITERSGGVWIPSPGSVYPALSQLEDEGLVTLSRVEGRNTASLTEEGTAYIEAHRAELGAPWDDVGGGVTRESRDLRAEIGALMGAAHQVAQVGTRAQVAAAVTTLAEARKALYRLLADDDPTA